MKPPEMIGRIKEGGRCQMKRSRTVRDTNDSQCSGEFEDVFHSRTAGSIRECDCGRTHFDGNRHSHWDWEVGELEELLMRAEKEPDKYIEHFGAVSTLSIGGEIVIGCKCDLAKKVEGFLRGNALAIHEFTGKVLLAEKVVDRVKGYPKKPDDGWHTVPVNWETSSDEL